MDGYKKIADTEVMARKDFMIEHFRLALLR